MRKLRAVRIKSRPDRMCWPRHLTQVQVHRSSSQSISNPGPSWGLCNALGIWGSGDTTAYAINTLTCYLVVNMVRKLASLGFDSNRWPSGENQPLNMGFSRDLCISYAKLTKSRTQARMETFEILANCGWPLCPQSPQLGDKGASGKTMLYSIWIGVGTAGDGAVVPRFPARKVPHHPPGLRSVEFWLWNKPSRAELGICHKLIDPSARTGTGTVPSPPLRLTKLIYDYFADN